MPANDTVSVNTFGQCYYLFGKTYTPILVLSFVRLILGQVCLLKLNPWGLSLLKIPENVNKQYKINFKPQLSWIEISNNGWTTL